MEVEELKQYFQPKTEYGDKLPNIKSVNDNTVFYLKTDGVYYEHIMFNSKWHKKKVDSSDNLILVEV